MDKICPKCSSESYSWDDPDVQECADCGYTAINNFCPKCDSDNYRFFESSCPDCGFSVGAGWGGKRSGAGRPPVEKPKVKTSISLLPETLELLKQIGSSRSEAIENLVKQYKRYNCSRKELLEIQLLNNVSRLIYWATALSEYADFPDALPMPIELKDQDAAVERMLNKKLEQAMVVPGEILYDLSYCSTELDEYY